tara:strand:+ start:1133 stop:1822 length:690 start_codon:yes stop_codon:yes gene_type:complete
MVNKNIVAIGGGGFGRSLGDLIIEKYIVSLVNKKIPKVCFLPTASGDNDLYKLNFYRAFSKLNCETTHLDFFSRTEDLEKIILSQDIIFVGGGNTKSMLAIWRDWNLDLILKKAFDKGIVMSGVSAGAICWFEKGITDSYAQKLEILNCLGFLKGIACPHFDEEKEREPYVYNLLKKRIINSCLCIEGYSALHFSSANGMKSVNFGDNKRCYELYESNKKILEKTFNHN